jgi:MYXO-CTERM domain-containing protein
MKLNVRNSVLAALLSAGLFSGAQADTMASGSLSAPGSYSYAFEVIASGVVYPEFIAYVTTAAGQFPVDSFLLENSSGAVLGDGGDLVGPNGFTSFSYDSLAPGGYVFSFSSSAAVGSFSLETSLTKGIDYQDAPVITVPESSTLAFALAGLGVLGFLGRRRSA